MKKLKLVLALLLGGIFSGFGQSPVLDAYVKEGLKSNLALKQENLELEKGIETLNQARSAFMPRIYFNATYTVAGGGRRLQFPVGDLLNPVYATLNQMTGSDRFPQIQNVDEQLTPNNFHETTIAFQQPIFNTDVYFNYKIQKDLVSAQSARRDLYENELKYSIITAYYQYLQTLEAKKIFTESKSILRELLKLNQKLVANNVATKDVVFSAEYEISKIDQQLAIVKKNEQTAQSYFNFLLNRDLSATIAADTTAAKTETMLNTATPAGAQVSEMQRTALSNRQEINQLNYGIAANENAFRLNRNNRFLPTAFIGGNIGYQGFGYKFDSSQDYRLAQIGLRWNIFSGFDKKSKMQQSRIQSDILNSKFSEVQQQIRLQVTQAYYDLEAARQSLAASREGSLKARQSFQIIGSKYRNQQAILVEFLRAQNDVTVAELSAVVAQYDVLVKQAQLDKVMALQ